jgi:hypothetical protein
MHKIQNKQLKSPKGQGKKSTYVKQRKLISPFREGTSSPAVN